MLDPDTDRPGGELYDGVLVQEIELLAELIEVVARAGRPLSDSEIDDALHVDSSRRAAHTAA